MSARGRGSHGSTRTGELMIIAEPQFISLNRIMLIQSRSSSTQNSPALQISWCCRDGLSRKSKMIIASCHSTVIVSPHFPVSDRVHGTSRRCNTSFCQTLGLQKSQTCQKQKQEYLNLSLNITGQKRLIQPPSMFALSNSSCDSIEQD